MPLVPTHIHCQCYPHSYSQPRYHYQLYNCAVVTKRMPYHYNCLHLVPLVATLLSCTRDMTPSLSHPIIRNIYFKSPFTCAWESELYIGYYV